MWHVFLMHTKLNMVEGGLPRFWKTDQRVIQCGRAMSITHPCSQSDGSVGLNCSLSVMEVCMGDWMWGNSMEFESKASLDGCKPVNYTHCSYMTGVEITSHVWSVGNGLYKQSIQPWTYLREWMCCKNAQNWRHFLVWKMDWMSSKYDIKVESRECSVSVCERSNKSWSVKVKFGCLYTITENMYKEEQWLEVKFALYMILL